MSGDLNARTVPESRFRAFVSYSHTDKAAAQRLHRKLESYRLPKHLRDANSNIASDGRVGAIFRDREDLPAAQDLTESVKEALSVSEALVVLCSPAAKASPWVAREIELFRELHPDRPILAALLHGEPDDAFPEPLRQGREPLAADLRKKGDGPRLGFLKVVAGIAGVPLDALINRDAQRRVRRVTAITVAALAAMVVMALMTTFAIQSRNEAQAQRAEAEGLVEYILTDLRDDLEGVGRLDVMQGVNDRALEYFGAIDDLEALPDKSLELNARVLHKIGQDELSLKTRDLKKAASIFGRAYDMTAELVSRDSRDGDRLFNHGQSAYWVGDLHYRKFEWVQAEQSWQEYRTLSEELMALDSNNGNWRLELGYALGNLCTLALHRTDKEGDSLALCKDALVYVESSLKAAPDDPDIQAAVANRLGWLGDALVKSGQPDAALLNYQMQHTMLQNLHDADPRNVKKADQLMRAKMTLAEFLSKVERPESATAFRRAAKSLAVRMVKIDPDNYWWANWLDRIEKHNGEIDE